MVRTALEVVEITAVTPLCCQDMNGAIILYQNLNLLRFGYVFISIHVSSEAYSFCEFVKW